LYLDAQDLRGSYDLDKGLRDSRSLLDKISFKQYPSKPTVLVIDEFQVTHPDMVSQARAKWENPNDQKIKSIIIAQISKQLKNVTPSFTERLGSRIITLPTMDDSEMKEILKIRLESSTGVNYYNRLHNEAINLLVACADGNPRRLLEYADLLFDFHYRKFGELNPILTNKTYLITYYGAKEILELKGINTDAYVYLSPEEKARQLEEFEKKYTREERQIISLLLNAPKTTEEIAKTRGLSKTRVQKIVYSLHKKKGLEHAGKKSGRQLWQASQHAKRLKVDV
jgi:hypothetical protein